MCEAADKLRSMARQARCLARQLRSGSRANALFSLASLYETQAAELEERAEASLICAH